MGGQLPDAWSGVMAPGAVVFECWNQAADDGEEAFARISGDGTLLRKRDRMFSNYNPFQHAECQKCRVQPLCKGGCPWEATKLDATGTGHCTTLRWNIEDALRLWHLEASLRQQLSTKPEQTDDVGGGEYAYAAAHSSDSPKGVGM